MNNEHVIRKEDYADDKYKVISFKGEKGDFKRAVSLNDSICILPFDMNENGQIKNVYLHGFHDHVMDRPNKKCITRTLHPDEFDTYHDSLIGCIGDELGLSKVEPNDIYYLGNIQHGAPFHKTYKAYAINVTDYSEDPTSFSYSKENGRHSLDKVRLSRVVNGEVSDSVVLSCTLLLLSYISE